MRYLRVGAASGRHLPHTRGRFNSFARLDGTTAAIEHDETGTLNGHLVSPQYHSQHASRGNCCLVPRFTRANVACSLLCTYIYACELLGIHVRARRKEGNLTYQAIPTCTVGTYLRRTGRTGATWSWARRARVPPHNSVYAATGGQAEGHESHTSVRAPVSLLPWPAAANRRACRPQAARAPGVNDDRSFASPTGAVSGFSR
jgi:hypothetical protein